MIGFLTLVRWRVCVGSGEGGGIITLNYYAQICIRFLRAAS